MSKMQCEMLDAWDLGAAGETAERRRDERGGGAGRVVVDDGAGNFARGCPGALEVALKCGRVPRLQCERNLSKQTDRTILTAGGATRVQPPVWHCLTIAVGGAWRVTDKDVLSVRRTVKR